MDEKSKEIIKNTIEQLLEKMGFSGQVALTDSGNDEESVSCNIATETDSNFLIGQFGANLQAIQHLARLIIRKKLSNKVRFTLDVNFYRQQKNQSNIEQAHAAANEAISQHRAVFMKPMSTYERRIVHLELSKNPDVSTESVGDGEERKIVVKPSDIID